MIDSDISQNEWSNDFEHLHGILLIAGEIGLLFPELGLMVAVNIKGTL
jgi:hypothetical protein